ncbi:DNA replication complex GINS protein PSF2 [Chamberlinius hualienensis]
MNSSEVEFIAENSKMVIVPNFSHDILYLISGDVGPFVAGQPVEVPLWMAINLKQRHKCRLIVPDWMDVDVLEAKKQEELESKVFTKMPCKHYMEVSQLILNNAVDEVHRADEIRTLVKDIWDVRVAKLRSSIDAFVKSDEIHAKLDNLTVLEINTIRSFLTKCLDNLYKIRKNTEGNTSLASQSKSFN